MNAQNPSLGVTNGVHKGVGNSNPGIGTTNGTNHGVLHGLTPGVHVIGGRNQGKGYVEGAGLPGVGLEQRGNNENGYTDGRIGNGVHAVNGIDVGPNHRIGIENGAINGKHPNIVGFSPTLNHAGVGAVNGANNGIGVNKGVMKERNGNVIQG